MADPLATIQAIEQAAARAWPGLEVADMDGWQLRHSYGVTRRANSVWPNELRLGEQVDTASLQSVDSVGLDMRVARVESFYGERNLPARFQLCPAAVPASLDAVLAARGYRAVAETAVQVARVQDALGHLADDLGLTATVAPYVDDAWMDLTCRIEEVETAACRVRRSIMEGIVDPAAYATVWVDEQAMAVGSAVWNGEWLGLFNIATHPAARRRGAGRVVMRGLLAWGGEQGAERCYLQVMLHNTAALAFYRRLGFTTLYKYHYREQRRE